MEVLVVVAATVGCGGLAGRWLRQVYFPIETTTSCAVLDASLGLSLALVVERLLESSSLPWMIWHDTSTDAIDDGDDNGDDESMAVGQWLCLAMVVHCTVVVPTWWSYSLLKSYEWCWGGSMSGRCSSSTISGSSYCRNARYWSLPTTAASATTSSSAEVQSTQKPFHVRMIHLVLSVVMGTLLSAVSLPWIIDTLVVRSNSSSNTTSLLDTSLSGLYAIGVLLAATLNGFGSVLLPYTFCIGWWIHPVHPSCLIGAEQDLAHTRAMLQQRWEARPNVNLSSSQQRLPRTFLGLGRVIQQQSETLRTEVAFLESLIEEQEADIVELRAALHTSQRAHSTWMGRCSLYLGYVFSVVLVVRLGVSILHIVSPTIVSGRASRPIEVVLAKLLVSLVWKSENHDGEEDAPIFPLEEATQYTSLLIALVLRVSSTRNFLRRAGSIQRQVWTMMGSNSTAILLLSLATGCYTLATTSHNAFVLRPGMVDLVYVATAVATTAVLVVVAHIVRANTLRYQLDKAEEDGAKKHHLPSGSPTNSSMRNNCDRIV